MRKLEHFFPLAVAFDHTSRHSHYRGVRRYIFNDDRAGTDLDIVTDGDVP